MVAGVSETPPDMEWIVSLIGTRAPKPNRPKVYRKHQISNRLTTPRREGLTPELKNII